MERPCGEIKNVLIAVTTLEAAIIAKLREFDYGQMTIKKREGKPYQIVKGGTELLKEETGLNLEDAIAIPPEVEVLGKSVSDILSNLNMREYASSEKAPTGGRGKK